VIRTPQALEQQQAADRAKRVKTSINQLTKSLSIPDLKKLVAVHAANQIAAEETAEDSEGKKKEQALAAKLVDKLHQVRGSAPLRAPSSSSSATRCNRGHQETDSALPITHQRIAAWRRRRAWPRRPRTWRQC
jgi:hypothetical protein